TRSSFGWRSNGRSPISSRSSVPPCASSKRPILRAMAPVKAPRSWPKSSLSRRPAGMAVQLNLTNGRARRVLSVWIRPPIRSSPDSVVIAMSWSILQYAEHLLEDLEQRRFADRLAQEFDRSRRPCPPLLVVAGPAGEEYDRDSHPALGEATLDLEPVHVRHAHVQHEARGSRPGSGGQKLLPGGKR